MYFGYAFSSYKNFLTKIFKAQKLTPHRITNLSTTSQIGIKSTIPNHQPKLTTHTTNNKTMHIAKTNLKTEKGNLLFSLFLDLANVNNNNKPYTPVEIIHKLV